MKVAIYARVSTSDQNPESQIHELREFAYSRKFTTFQEYVDQTTGSARRPTTSQFHQLMKDAKQRKFDCVLVWKFDRFARSLPALLDALKTFDALGVSFISMTQEIDTSTPMGKLFFSIVGSFAEFERDVIIERTKAGVANARRKGRIAGPKRDLSIEAKVRKLKENGMGVCAIARRVKRSAAGVLLILKRSSLPPAKAGRNRE